MKSSDHLAAIAVMAGALAIDGCAGAQKNGAVEYSGGVLTVAADPAAQDISRPREITRNRVLAMLGAGAEGRQADGSYVLCADMGPVFAGPNTGDEEADRVACRFEHVLMDQVNSLIIAEDCAQYFTVNTNYCLPATGFSGFANRCVTASPENVKMAEGIVKGLANAKSRHAGNYVCLWTTPPQEVICK